MTRSLSMLSAGALLAVAAHAQCLPAPAAGSVTLVQWSSSSSYASTFAANDEGITNPPIDLTPAFGAAGFPMAGAIGVLDRLWINSNGELYLTDSTLALTQPVGGALFGVNTIDEARGAVAGASPRIFPLGGDHQGSIASGAVWAITCDVLPGMVQVSWTDMRRYANTTDRFSFGCTLFASGVVQFDYGNTFPAPSGFTDRWVGLSIGNQVGSAASPSRDLTAGCAGNDSGTEGLLYQSFLAAGSFDLNGRSLLITPNGIGGYCSTVICTPANHENYGTGCYTYAGQDDSSLVELFAGTPTAKAALDGNAVLFTLAGNGYVANWLPGVAGALYVAPTGGATIVANADDTTTTFSPSTAVPVPGGLAPTWNVSSNGVLTAAATGNNGTSYTATLAAVGTAPNLGWYCWRDYNPLASGSGKVKTEEVGTMLYVTFDGVYEFGTTQPATFQWQIDMA
ncbi:MAG: hypothetical protein KF830_00785, partial [Planctomycetes bacterium]|nr:hypothetical protein [Planctomycetota bacterium]